MSRKSGQCGVTLLELMVVVAIIGVLASLATVGLQAMVATTQLRQAVTDLKGDMEKAKMEAIKENTPVLVDFSPGSPGSYAVCVDGNGNNGCGDAGDTEVLQQSFAGYDRVRLSSASFDGGNSYVEFNGRGLPVGLGAGSVNCTSVDGDVRIVDMASSGRIRIE